MNKVQQQILEDILRHYENYLVIEDKNYTLLGFFEWAAVEAEMEEAEEAEKQGPSQPMHPHLM